MAAARNRPPSLSGVIDEIASLYPELSPRTVRRLFSKSPVEDVAKTESTTGKVKTEERCIFSRNIEVIDIDSSSSSSEDENEIGIIKAVEVATKETKHDDPKKTPLKDRQPLDEFLKFRTPTPVKFGRMRTFSTPSSVPSNEAGSVAYENDFLASLAELVPPFGFSRVQESLPYMKSFTRRKVELVSRLFKTFNQHVFENRLPHDLPCQWNVRMTKTAGICAYKTNENGLRTAAIELSTKVCDNAERVRDTLVHEMCHAAAWVIHGSRGGHDSTWKYWARQANRAFAALPPIKRCHAYQIHAKFLYTCTRCGRQIRRHTKSLDIDKKICGICHGRFELRENIAAPSSSGTSTPKPRSTPQFALFVKSNYSEIKGKTPHATHREIMRSLGETFKKLDFNDRPQV